MTIHATYKELVDALGYPEDFSGSYKVDVQWDVEDVDTGRFLVVWNYGNGPNYLGEDGTPVSEIESWSADGDLSLAEDLGFEVENMEQW